MHEYYDVIIIGAGPGGYEAALRAAQLGMKVAVVESRELGGTCLNRGCIPTKTLLHAAESYQEAKEFETLGISLEGLNINVSKIYERKDEIVQKLRSGIEMLFKNNKIAWIKGQGRIIDPETVLVTTENEPIEVKGAHLLIATGAKPILPSSIEGIHLPGVMTSDELLSSDRVYERLIIIGGGVIGVEFAAYYNALGTEVTLIEAKDRILPTMDREISQNLSMIYKKRGIKIHTGAMVKSLTAENGITCTFDEKGCSTSIAGDAILVAIGRKPNTEGLFSENLGIKVEKGRISVDEHFQTNIPSIYAIGDVASTWQLAHVATAQGITATLHMKGLEPSINLNVIPSCIYTSPEIATVGMTADEAKEKGFTVEVAKVPMTANARTMIAMEDRSFIKIIIDQETDKILGAQLMCARASDIISELTTAMASGLTASQMASIIRPHPTFSEAITGAFGK